MKWFLTLASLIVLLWLFVQWSHHFAKSFPQ